ncbi:hypothetical protein [Sorangium sp. So ce513]|uniref:hypothetical protein n=1 Tax=Sorangium sp. So ce513 TaxID=3133315 RepID=UPI003F644246
MAAPSPGVKRRLRAGAFGLGVFEGERPRRGRPAASSRQARGLVAAGPRPRRGRPAASPGGLQALASSDDLPGDA